MRSRRLAIALAVLHLAGCRSTEELTRRSLVTLDGLVGLSAAVQTIVDEHGIPHIYAASRADAAFALGWFHARDRFLQMDILRRSGWGRLAEILGPAAVEEDRFARTLGLHRAARTAWESLVPVRERGILEAYAQGVNAFLAAASSAELPAFYRDNGLVPEPWIPADAFAIHKRFTVELGHSFDDVFLQVVAEKLGHEAVATLFPVERDARVPVVRHPRSADYIMRLRRRTAAAPQRAPGSRDDRPPPVEPGRAAPVTGIADECIALLERWAGVPARIAGPGGLASNAWAVSGGLSADGRPILCGDPHLAFSHPSTFYTAHLHSPGLGVIGVTIPGTPAVIFGHNGSVAWTGTNAQADVTDFYVETFDPQNPDLYQHRGRWLRVETIDEEIAVRDRENVTFQVRRTTHGPIVTDRGKSLAMRWKGELATAEVVSFLRINEARDVQSFLDALRLYVAPAITFVFAEVNGRIAARPSGEVPRRARGLGRFPVDGANGEHEWLAPVPFEEMPLSVDPPHGYIVSANQRLAPPDFPYYLGWEFDPSFRARRIAEVLSSHNRFTPRLMRQLQLDTLDVCLRDLVPVLVQAFAEEPPSDPIANLAVRLLRAWDFVFREDAVEPTIAWKWLQLFADDVWSDEWERAQIPRSGNWGFCSNGWRPPLDVLVQLTLDEPQSAWFDDVRTPEREDRNAIVRRSLLAAVAEIGAEYGPGISSWTWGRRNRMVVPDLLRSPDGAIDLGPIPGSSNTVCPGGDGGAVTSGAVYRVVFPLDDLAASRGATPGAQAAVLSGVDAESLARQQADSYLDGSYFPLHYEPSPGDFPKERAAQLFIMTPRWLPRDGSEVR